MDENTAYDIELSIDLEMLGRIFENLLAEIDREDATEKPTDLSAAPSKDAAGAGVATFNAPLTKTEERAGFAAKASVIFFAVFTIAVGRIALISAGNVSGFAYFRF